MAESENQKKIDEKWGRLLHKCGWERCDFKGDTRGDLFAHLEKVHGVVRKKPDTNGNKEHRR